MTSNTLFDLVASFAKADPNKLAVITPSDGNRTYRELVANSLALAVAMRTRLHIQPSERICLWLENHPAWVEVYLAASASGIGVVGLNPDWTDDELEFALEHSEICTVICDAERANRLASIRRRHPNIRHVVSVGLDNGPAPQDDWSYSELVSPSTHDDLPFDLQLDDTAMSEHILYTSGTTSARPKAVVGRIRGAVGPDYKDIYGNTSVDRALVITPFFHGNGLGGLMTALTCGASVVFPRRFSAGGFWQLVDLFRPTYLFTLAPLVNIILGQSLGATDRTHSFRFIVAAGCAQNAPMIEEKLGIPILDVYGMTEALGSGTLMRLSDTRKPGSSGKRVPGSTMTIIDDDGSNAAAEQIGEVVFKRGSIHFDGYLKDDEATAAVLDNEYFHTGDLGYFDAEGYFFYVDRKKDIVRRGGENISSMEVEDAIRSFEAVCEVAIVGKPDAILGERVAAFIVLSEGQTLDVEGLKEHVGRSLARYKFPESIYLLNDLPRTGTGKIIKRSLREMLTDPLSVDDVL
jgi:acyl-CoA synthetase (AMP-forming)/AMP-acid ligase II